MAAKACPITCWKYNCVGACMVYYFRPGLRENPTRLLFLSVRKKTMQARTTLNHTQETHHTLKKLKPICIKSIVPVVIFHCSQSTLLVKSLPATTPYISRER